jgi:hypothetical protein
MKDMSHPVKEESRPSGSCHPLTIIDTCILFAAMSVLD